MPSPPTGPTPGASPASGPAPARTSLRGTLSQKPLGARGIEQFARNPSCLRLALLTGLGLTPGVVLEGAFDKPVMRRPPPTSVVLGKRYERALLRDGATALLDRYHKEGLLALSERSVIDVAAAHPGTSTVDLDRRLRLTERLIERRRRGDPSAPNLIVMPRLMVRVGGADHGIEPDFLVAAGGDRCYRPGEIKSYADRKGKTDPAKVRGARRQASVTIVALRQLYGRLGSADAEAEVDAEVDLFFRWPQTLKSTLRRERVDADVWSIERALAGLDDAVRRAAAHVPPGTSDSLDDPAVVESVPNHFTQGCYEFCDLACACKAEAVRREDPALLGDGAQEALSGVHSLKRARDLMHRRVKPQDEAEAAVQGLLAGALDSYRSVIAHA